jgi:hypothetical protein
MNRRWVRYGLLTVSTTLLMGVAGAPALAGSAAGEKTKSTVSQKGAFVPAFERGTVTSITSKGGKAILRLNTGKQVVTVILTAKTEVAKDRVQVPRSRLTVGATVVVKGVQLGKGTVEAYVIVLV